MRALFLVTLLAGGCLGRAPPEKLALCDPAREVACEADPEPEVPHDCDPIDPTCTQCDEQSDCAGGQVCASGLCLDAAGRVICTSSFQCPAGESCDRDAFLCVPKRECRLCPDLPHLCCNDDEACSARSGFCEVVAARECNEDSECVVGLICDALGRCAQCERSRPCGPGLVCDEADGACISDNTCATDDDCRGNQRCAPSTFECVLPACLTDTDCTDPRLFCDLGTFGCALRAPVCPDDVDEENDTAELASAIVDGAAFSGTLCRDDIDVLSFRVTPDRRYTATVDFGRVGQPGILITMLGSDGSTVESAATFTAQQSSLLVAGVTGPEESGVFFLKVLGNNDDADQWAYVVTVAAVAAVAP